MMTLIKKYLGISKIQMMKNLKLMTLLLRRLMLNQTKQNLKLKNKTWDNQQFRKRFYKKCNLENLI
jgi:hypothetical protein